MSEFNFGDEFSFDDENEFDFNFNLDYDFEVGNTSNSTLIASFNPEINGQQNEKADSNDGSLQYDFSNATQNDITGPFVSETTSKDTNLPLSAKLVNPSELSFSSEDTTSCSSKNDSISSQLCPTPPINIDLNDEFLVIFLKEYNNTNEKVQSYKMAKDTKPAKICKQAKPIPCPLCPRYLPTNCHLNRHVNSVHLQIRNHVCVRCKKAFKRKDQLKAHENKKKACAPN